MYNSHDFYSANVIFFRSCVSTINKVLFSLSPPPTRVDISIVHQSVTVGHALTIHRHTIQSMLEDAGFDVSDPASEQRPSQQMSSTHSEKRQKHLQQCSSCQEVAATALEGIVPPLLRRNVSSNSVSPIDCSMLEKDKESSPRPSHEVDVDDIPHLVTLSVGGMTCSACPSTITEMVSQLPGISEVVVSLLNHSATIVVARRDLVGSVTEAIDDCGYEVDVIKVEPLVPSTSESPAGPRNLSLRIDGMYCQCVDLHFVASSVTESADQKLSSKDYDCLAKAPARRHHCQTVIKPFGPHNGIIIQAITSRLHHPLHHLGHCVRGAGIIHCIDLSSAYARRAHAQLAAARATSLASAPDFHIYHCDTHVHHRRGLHESCSRRQFDQTIPDGALVERKCVPD
jgi:copper chaperone CopZ